MKKEQVRFLETIGALGYDVLIPIERIKYINISFHGRWEIRFYSDDGDWVECFDSSDEGQKKLDLRYSMIKEILNGK